MLGAQLALGENRLVCIPAMSVELLTEHHLEFLNLKRGSTCSSESKLVIMPHCWKSHVAAQMVSGTTFFVHIQSFGSSRVGGGG